MSTVGLFRPWRELPLLEESAAGLVVGDFEALDSDFFLLLELPFLSSILFEPEGAVSPPLADVLGGTSSTSLPLLYYLFIIMM